jgi:hypothetical protein
MNGGSQMPAITKLGDTVWCLPPLILHPFNEHVPASALLENSKAALILSGLVPGGGADPAELHRRLLSGRYAEIRMLFFLGKDVHRWIEQCLESLGRDPALHDLEIRGQSFAGLLTAYPPQPVKDKLLRWGVADYVSIFSRAIGLNAMFTQPPLFDSLTEEFMRGYHRYADALYQCYLAAEPHCDIEAHNFPFDLYASGEYSQMLETEWGKA